MFDLERAIEEWRREMTSGGINSSAVLDELESHLRDDIERQVRAGLLPAFDAVVRRIGQAAELKAEFVNAVGTPGIHGQWMGFIGAVLVGFILLMSGFTFLQMEMSAGEQVVAYAAVILSLAVACGWRYAVPFLPILPGPRTRWATGIACMILGFVSCSFFVDVIVPRFELSPDRQLPAIGFWGFFLLTVFVCLGLALVMGARDRENLGMGRTAHGPAAPRVS